MLKKIVLILTQEYKEQQTASGEYLLFAEEMNRHGSAAEIYGINMQTDMDLQMKTYLSMAESAKKICAPSAKEETLYLSDDAHALLWLQEKNRYTIAVYHKKIEGTLPGTRYAIEGTKNIEWEYLYKIYQRFKEEPWDITETRRCLIREMCENDVDALFELYSSPLVTRYTDPLFQKKEDEKEYIRSYVQNVYQYYGFGTWLIVRKEDGRLIGCAGFNYRAGYDEAELGFVIGEPFWRMGYAYEVCSHLLMLGKQVYEFEMVQALTDKQNEASARLLEKLGFYYTEDVNIDKHEYRRYLHKLAI